MNLFVSLKYLVALDDHRHFGRAALACSVTQPALSNAIRALEENFGTSIVKRGRNFAGFTDRGRAHPGERAHACCASTNCCARTCTAAKAPPRPPDDRRGADRDADRGALRRDAAGPPSGHRADRALDELDRAGDRPGEPGARHGPRLHRAHGRWPRARCAWCRNTPSTTSCCARRRSAAKRGPACSSAPPTTWKEAAALPLCLLSPEMHNRTIVDRAFAAVGVPASRRSRPTRS